MAEPFIGEIRLFGGTKIPNGWAACEGQTLAISRNQALFSILGTQFGGDGVSTFKLPDLRGRVPLGVSPSISQGVAGGEAAHALMSNELPGHTHSVTASSAGGTVPALADHFWASEMNYTEDTDTQMHGASIATAGAGAPHENMQPYLAVTFWIATAGIYPPRP